MQTTAPGDFSHVHISEHINYEMSFSFLLFLRLPPIPSFLYHHYLAVISWWCR